MLMLSAFYLVSCGEDDETCEKDEDICTVVVTVCCTSESECTYQVGDKEYDTFEEASQDSECAATSAPNNEPSRVMESLKALTARAKANL